MNQQPPRWIVVQLIPAMNSGGAERSTLEIAKALIDAGHRAVVISAGGRWVEDLLEMGAEHQQVDIGKKSLWTLRHIWTLRKIFKNLQPDIVHARSRLPAWLGWCALKTMRKPKPRWVTTVHGFNSVGRYSKILTSGERVIAVSQAVSEFIQKHYPSTSRRRIAVIPRGVSDREFPHAYSPSVEWCSRFYTQFPQLMGKQIICLPGRGTRLKNHADAIKIFAHLFGSRKDIGLMLPGIIELGREVYLLEMQELAASLGVETETIFSPPRNDIKEIMAASAVVLQVSKHPETFGRTVVEALSLGTPVVGYAHGGVGELLHELFEQGAVPLGDIETMVARINAILNSPPQLPPVSAYRLAQMQQATLAVYASVIGDKVR